MTATTETAPSLSERLDGARKAEAAPRQRVAELQAALSAAETARHWPEVARLEAELGEAQGALAFASSVATALSDQATAIERGRRDREAARERAEQVARAQEVIGEALEAERAAHGQVAERVALMYDHLHAARAEFIRAQEAERAVAVAQGQAIAARVTAGELAAAVRAPGANAASVLEERDPLVRELLRWTGPPQRAVRPVVSSTAPPADGRALTRQSPWAALT